MQKSGTYQRDPTMRIVIAELPTITVEAVRQMFKQREDVVLEAEATDPIDLLQKVQPNTNLVVLGTQGADMPGICTHLLAEFPELRIVVLNTMTDQADIYWLGIHRKPLGKLAFESLISDLKRGVSTTY